MKNNVVQRLYNLVVLVVDMESIKEYASRKNVSYEAVRKQVKRYEKDLEGHITKVGKKQYLDDEAVAFLDDKREKNPIVVIQADKDERIEELERENKLLLVKVAELHEKLEQKSVKIELLQQEKIELLEVKTQKQPGFFARLFGKE